MGCFKIPLGLCPKIEALIKKFWWGQRVDSRKIYWLRWDEMTKSKMVSGMGFRDLTPFNDSLLAKQAWRFLHNKSSLFHKVFKARFFSNCSIMKAIDSRLGSYAWRSILIARYVLQKGARWRVGNEEKKKKLAAPWAAKETPTTGNILSTWVFGKYYCGYLDWFHHEVLEWRANQWFICTKWGWN